MRFSGKVFKGKKFWLTEVPTFDAMTQGRTRKDALRMIGDWFETAVNQSGFKVTVYPGPKGTFEIEGSDSRAMIALALQRLRHSSGLSLADVAKRLGATSRNTYARYERGRAMPSVEKFDELVRAVSPERIVVFSVTGEERTGC